MKTSTTATRGATAIRPHSPSCITALPASSTGTRRPGPKRPSTRDIARAATSEMTAATATIRGRLVTLKWER